MGPTLPGQKQTTAGNKNDLIIDISDSINYLNPAQDGIAYVKKILSQGTFDFANHDHYWTQDSLAPRFEPITTTNSATTITVVNAYRYYRNMNIRCEAEVMRVTAIASATSLTVIRGYAGTTAVAHTAARMIVLGVADPEGASAGQAASSDPIKLFNYDQTFKKDVELSTDEIAKLSTTGNPMNHQTKLRTIELWREFATAFFYGVKGFETTSDASNRPVYSMGGILSFLQTNVYNIAGALTISAIDKAILDITLAGGDPKSIVLSPYQKQKLDALDNNKQLLGKKEHTGGGLITQTWQSGVLNHTLDIYMDHTINPDELIISDEDLIKIGFKNHNGISGKLSVVPSTLPGDDSQKKTMRMKPTVEVRTEAGLARLYGLS